MSIAGVSWPGGVHESTIIDCPIDTENPSGAVDATWNLKTKEINK